MLGVRVLLLDSLAFELDLQDFEHRQLVRRHHVNGWAIDRSVPSEDELHDLGGCNHRHGSKLEQRLGRLDLAALDIKALALAGAEQLFDVPALAIPGDNLQRLSTVVTA